MRNDLAEIAIVVDKSGSMQSLTQETITGFNDFINDQRKVPGDANVTLTLFDSKYEILHNSVPLNVIPYLSAENYQAGGYTALNDAVCRTIEEVGKNLALLPENDRPSKVIFVIITDGLENSSKEYTHDQLAAMIKHQTEVYNWEFIYLAAGVDQPQVVAAAMNISPMNVSSFANTSAGVSALYAENSARITRSRTSR